MSPCDRPMLAVMRFALELVAVAVILAGVGLAGFISAVLVLVVFGTPGDKRVLIIPIPGPVRAMVEFVVFIGAIDAIGSLWGIEWTIAGVATLALYCCLARKRLLWLLRGAPQ